MWKVYMLRSDGKKWFYVGSTDNLKRRLGEHKKGRVRATKGYKPLSLVYTQDCENEKEARALEHKIKSKRLLKEQIVRTIEK